MKKEQFKYLLETAIKEYYECTERDERTSVVQTLIDELYKEGTPEKI